MRALVVLFHIGCVGVKVCFFHSTRSGCAIPRLAGWPSASLAWAGLADWLAGWLARAASGPALALAKLLISVVVVVDVPGLTACLPGLPAWAALAGWCRCKTMLFP